MSLNKHHLTENLLTHLRLCSLIQPMVSFQMVETDPGFSRLSVPFTFTARVKQSVSKCSEHTPNLPVGLKFCRCCDTNLLYFVRMLPLDWEVCTEMPNSLSETQLQYCTTQRLGGILKVVNTRKDLLRRLTLSESQRKLPTMFWCDKNMTSLPIWLTSANPFYARSFLNPAMADGQNQETRSK